MLARPSYVLYRPCNDDLGQHEIPRPGRRYGRHKPPKEEDVIEDERRKQFWKKAKTYFEEVRTGLWTREEGGACVQVDAFELAVESPTPFKKRNQRGVAEEILLAALEEHRRLIQPLPKNISIAAAVDGRIQQRSPRLQSAEDALDAEAVVEAPLGQELEAIEEELCVTPRPPSHPLLLDNPFSLRRPRPRQETPVSVPRCSRRISFRDGESAVPEDPFQALLDACQQRDVNRNTLPCMEDLLKEKLDLDRVLSLYFAMDLTQSLQVVKIGEGAFGEAFKFESIVVKIIPFEGSTLICGYEQMKAEHLLPEVLISKLLADLRKPLMWNGTA